LLLTFIEPGFQMNSVYKDGNRMSIILWHKCPAGTTGAEVTSYLRIPVKKAGRAENIPGMRRISAGNGIAGIQQCVCADFPPWGREGISLYFYFPLPMPS
jgi:hypothetical protein